jgi:hypothetical protein
METFGSGQGFLKAGFLGFNKSGKTFTATLLALELRKRLELKGPVALFDTEGSGEYIAPLVKRNTNAFPIGVKSRSLVDLLKCARECEAGAASILIVDSITHVWREVMQAYLEQINKVRDAKGQPRRVRLEFQDWNTIKEKWSEWPDYYLNSKLHIIVCGRAGNTWEFQESENPDGTTHKELVKTGTKMKVEAEFGFEPSLLVEMERLQVPDEKRPGHFLITHRATVIGDRFNAMDGASTENPVGAWFSPHLDLLTPGAVNTVDMAAKTDLGVNEQGDAEFVAERHRRAVLCEEIEGEIVKAYPGQSKEEKKAKVLLIEKAFETTSWIKVQAMPADRLKIGLDIIRETFKAAPALAVKGGE